MVRSKASTFPTSIPLGKVPCNPEVITESPGIICSERGISVRVACSILSPDHFKIPIEPLEPSLTLKLVER